MDYGKLLCAIEDATGKKIAVLGDFALDKYLVVDAEKHEISLETCLEAYQIKRKRVFPGAAGTVTNNLCALGVGKIWAIGAIGDDGDGYELERGLIKTGVDTKYLIKSEEKVTFTYTKPIIEQNGTVKELNRLDIKNWDETTKELEDKIIENIDKVVEEVDALVVLDQLMEKNCGVVTDRIIKHLEMLGDKYPDLVIYADSRLRPSKFRNVIVKCNHHELLRIFDTAAGDGCDDAAIERYGKKLYEMTRRPVFVTRGEKGIMVFDGAGTEQAQALKIEPPVDICGAGDATSSGIVCGLCGGLKLCEAAALGNIVSSVTIKKLGTTGTASPDEVRAQIELAKSQWN